MALSLSDDEEIVFIDMLYTRRWMWDSRVEKYSNRQRLGEGSVSIARVMGNGVTNELLRKRSTDPLKSWHTEVSWRGKKTLN